LRDLQSSLVPHEATVSSQEGSKTYPAYRGVLFPSLRPIHLHDRWIGLLTSNLTGDSEIFLWNLASRQKRVLAAETEEVSKVCFVNGARWLAAGVAAGKVTVWDVASGQLTATLVPEGSESLTAMVCSPKGTASVTGSESGIVRLWRIPPEPAPVR